MANTSFYFNFVDSCNNPLTGSRISLTAYSPPYVTGSMLSFGAPIIEYTDNNGYVEFDSIVSGIYKVVIGNANDNNPVVMKNYPATVFYIQIPDTDSLVNGINYKIS